MSPAKDLGTRYVCWNCSTRFYDLKKPAPICPKCGADQRESPPKEPVKTTPRKAAAAARAAEAEAEVEEKEEVVEEEEETFDDDTDDFEDDDDDLADVDDEDDDL